jgi:hypothetical protein
MLRVVGFIACELLIAALAFQLMRLRCRRLGVAKIVEQSGSFPASKSHKSSL